MQPSTAPSPTPSLPRPWYSWLADAVLVGLLSGPIAAPFLTASGLPMLTSIADIIYTLGGHVCPQPELGLPLAGAHRMAVCMRCYGTLLGVVMMRVGYARDRGQSAFWLAGYGTIGFGIAFVICMAYPAEFALQGFTWWPTENWRMIAFGWLAGLGLGAYLMPLLHAPTAPETEQREASL